MSDNFKKILAKIIGQYINLLSYILPDKALVLAYGFFSEPRNGKLQKDKLPEILQQATLENIKYKEHEFQTYTWLGNQNKILLVHGWESNAARWEKLLHILKKSNSTIIAIDGPAHGLSSGTEFNVPTYAEFINEICKIHSPKIIIGHSMGGVACSFYQHHYPQNHLEKMILLGSPSDFNVLMQNFANTLGLNFRVCQLIKDHIKKRFSINTDEFNSQKFLKNTTITGIIAHDINDNVVAFSEAQKLAATWQKAQFIETKDLGHSMHDDKLYQSIYQYLFEA
ncbi:alpha/beta hydrolase [Flavobacterium sp.]|uniref:alpha/beta fold hydrolase n=1 Tax=Flavobacterium sp. TaxID=239 RepID=UPI00286DA57A|nr:alpha/beta hydrolase [Flavobacterium sp.]